MKLEMFKSKYAILYWNLGFIYFFVRNYNLFMVIMKNILIAMTIVFLHAHPLAQLVIIMTLLAANTTYLFAVKPYLKKQLSYLQGVNEGMTLVVLSLITGIYYVTNVDDSDQGRFKERMRTAQTIGWVIIGLIMAIFTFNWVMIIKIEFATINNFFARLVYFFCKNASKNKNREGKVTDHLIKDASLHPETELGEITANQHKSKEKDSAQ